MNRHQSAPPLDPQSHAHQCPTIRIVRFVGNTNTSCLSCGIGPVTKPLTTTLTNPGSCNGPSKPVPSATRVPHCKVLSSSLTILSREGGTTAHRNHGVGRLASNKLLAMDEKVQTRFHDDEETDAVMLRSRNITKGEKGAGLKSFPVSKIRMLLLV